MQEQVKSTVRFADFELDLDTAELCSNDCVTSLQEKPFRILTLLLEHPGQLVSREQLVKQLWPEGTFVDFDQSLNKAVNRLREALGDSAEQPRLIETLPRRGYRFIGQIERPFLPEMATEPVVVVAQPSSDKISQLLMSVGLGALALLVIGLGAWWIATHQRGSNPLQDIKQRQLTFNSSENAVTSGVISADGKRLAYSDVKGIHIQQIDTGQIWDIPVPESVKGTPQSWLLINTWIRDGSAIVADANPSAQSPSIWLVPLTGGTMRKVRDNALAWTVSRDGKWVAFGANLDSLFYRELWIMHPDGTDAHKVFDADKDATFGGAEFSPDGKRLAYVKLRQLPDRGEMTFESRPIEGGPVTTAIGKFSSGVANDWSWSPDGRIIYSFMDDADHTCNFWQVRIDTKTGIPTEKPKQLTNWSGFRMDSPSFSANGRRLTFVRSSSQSTLYVAEQGTGTGISPPVRMTLNEGENEPVGWTEDNKTLVFVSNLNGHPELLQQVVGEETARPIAATLEDSAYGAQISPDGRWVFYLTYPNSWGASQPKDVMKVPLAGGMPKLIMRSSVNALPSLRCAQRAFAPCVIAERSPDHTQLVFTEVDAERGRGHELARVAVELTPDAQYDWDISPDGTHVAILKESEATISLLSLVGQATRQISVRGQPKLYGVDWAADGNGFYISAAANDGSTLLHLDLQGNALPLWHAKGGLREPGDVFRMRILSSRAVPSRDGRYLAIQHSSVSSNAWMMENF